MPVHPARLRAWLAIGVAAMMIAVAAAYLAARWRVGNVLKRAPEKIGLNIQQSATGFTISKSDQGRTLFKVQASKAVQFKLGGRTELHDVEITVYGRDSSRFDRIAGQDFIYEPSSGNISARGQVSIDLEANPEGVLNPDQALPKELKNPIHLKTGGLVFNQKTGDAFTTEKIEFTVDDAQGSAVGASYTAKNSVLTLQSEIQISFSGLASGLTPASVTASHGTIEKDPALVSLEHPELRYGRQLAKAGGAKLFLRPNSKIDRVLAGGNITLQSSGAQAVSASAKQVEMFLRPAGDELRNAVLSGDVHIESAGNQAIRVDAGEANCDFGKRNQLTKVHADKLVRMTQSREISNGLPRGQNLELTASAMDFFLRDGRRFQSAQTSGEARVVVHSSDNSRSTPLASGASARQTTITAGKFEAKFDDAGQIRAIHGAPDARIVAPADRKEWPDRVSTSDALEITVKQGNRVSSVSQSGHFAYSEGDRKATAERATYSPDDHLLVLTGFPRMTDEGIAVAAHSMQVDFSTGNAIANGQVKTTYTGLKPVREGALFASSDPIHVAADTMTASRSPSRATFQGKAQLWQGANVISAPSIEFDHDRLSVVARGSSIAPVKSSLLQNTKAGKAEFVTITSSTFSYIERERTAHLEGPVLVKQANATVASEQMDIFLQAGGQSPQKLEGAGKVDRIIAQGNIEVTQQDRKATGDKLVYTASDDKFVLTGKTPSIFDANHGKITGVSLTLFGRDGRVLVEGSDKSPALTQSQVAR